ncbi:amino acid adenylation domain-containing protein [Nocardia sp. NPDC047038]|uniref:amino acid adenylation domain-containing protein n=1 Tax=Nocardia sp. NPDC047038 TaxID=3154338 RepID=UPI003407A4AE
MNEPDMPHGNGIVLDPGVAERIAALPPEARARFERALRERANRRGAVSRVTDAGPSAVSAAQRRMWALHQMSPAAGNYAVAVRLRGVVHPIALRAAMREVVRRHETLRTAYRLDSDALRQIVHDRVEIPWRLVDLTECASSPEPLLRAEARRPFELSRPPMIRVTLLRTASDEHILLLVLHHIATDGWSNSVLIEELSRAYRELRQGRPAALPDLAITYRDYAAWQRGRLAGPEYGELSRFWDDYLRGAPELDLPGDVGRHGDGRRGASADEIVLVPAHVTDRLAEHRRQAGGSMFMLVLAAIVAQLRAVTGQSDIVVGTLVAGRLRVDLERLIGCFIDVLPLRFAAESADTFERLWRHVRERALAAQAHQEMPFEELARVHGARYPLVRVVCVLQPEPPRLDLPDVSVEIEHVDLGATHFDLVIEIRQRGDGMQIAFHYDTGVFTAPTVRALAGQLGFALERIADDPRVPCDRLLPSPAVVPVRLPAPPVEPTLHGLVERQARRTPDAVALLDGARQLTYRQLGVRAHRLARRLHAIGVRPEDRVAVLLPRSMESVVATLAVLEAGAVYVPLDPAHPEVRLAELITDAGPRCVVVADAGPIPGYRGAVLSLDERTFSAAAEELPALPRYRARADNAAYLLYTSGSTGTPKGVLGLHRGAVNRVRWSESAYPFRPGEVCVAKTAPGFVDSIWETFGPLAAGVPLLVLGPDEAQDPARLARGLARFRVTRLVAVPSLISALLDEVPDLGHRVPTLRLCVVSGEALDEHLVRRFHRHLPGRTLVNLYGSSEVSADATAAEIGDGGGRPPIGVPIAGVSARVYNDRLRPVAPLVRGELSVGGDCVARGYHRRPGATAAVFRPDPHGPRGARLFRTGDAVRPRADGALDYLGRLDAQVQVRGHRIEPGEVEVALLGLPGVRSAAVAARPGPGGDPILAGYLVCDESVDLTDILDRLRNRLPGYLIPDLLVRLAALPRTAGGKIDRRRLPDPEPVRERTAGELPRAGTETVVAEIFEELLTPGTRPCRDDDFFALGGHSVAAARVAAAIRRRCDVAVGMRDVFAAPTVAALARMIDAGERGTAGSAPPAVSTDPAAAGEPFPLTDVQQAYLVGRDASLELGAVATHAYFELVADELHLDRFSAALRAVIDRHPMLRAVVRVDGTQQVSAQVPPYRIAVQDLRELSESDRERRLLALREEMSHQVLPADRWPLFDVRVSRCPAHTVVHAGIDALICDAYSVGLILTELGRRYRDPDYAPDTVPVTFRDYVLAETARRDTPEYTAALEYWRERAPELPEGPALPLTATPESVVLPRFERRAGSMPAPRWSALKARAAAAGLSASAVLLSAFAEILTAWSRAPHYTLTLTVFRREPIHPRVAEIVGDFTSLTLLEVDHTASGSFLERAGALQERLWRDLDHSQVSGVAVARERAAHHGTRPRLTSPVVFTSNLDLPPLRPDDEDTWSLGDSVFGITQTPQVYLDHQVGEQRGDLVFNWDTVAELFAPGVLDAMFDAYRELLEWLAEGDWRRRAPVVVPAAHLARRERVNATAAPLPTMCLHDTVFAAADRFGARTAVIDGAVRLTYHELADRARRVGAALRDFGVCRGEPVAVVVGKGWQLVVAVLGVLESGAAFVPIDPKSPVARRDQLIERATARVVCITRADAGADYAPGVSCVAVDDDALPLPRTPAPAAAALDSLAYVIFTSGSTGEPKGVMIDHRGAANTVDSVNRRFGIGPDDRVLAVSPLGFDLAVYDIFGVLSVGGAVVMPEGDRRRDPAHWAELIARERVTLWNSVPALADVLTGYAGPLAPHALRTLRVVLLSGDWIALDLPGRIRALAPSAEVVSLGGATEGSIWSVWYPIGAVDPTWRSIPYGIPMDNQTMHVLDRALRPRPDWVPGDLYIGGTGVALGYWGDPRRTARSFLIDPVSGERRYRTGDLARYRADGTLEFLGREDNQVKINGFRVELGEIESVLERQPGVGRAAVVALGAPGGSQRLAGFVTAAGDTAPDPADLRRGLTGLLPAYLVPGALHAVPRLPLTANGKVDRAELIRLAERHSRGRASADSGAATGDLAALWREVLKIDEIGPNDSFFVLGGTSLQAIRLLDLVHQRLGVRVPLVRLLDEPTLSALATVIAEQRLRPADPAETLPALRPDPNGRFEPFPLTDIQQAYWLGRRTTAALGGVATHSYVELEVEDLDPIHLERALRRLVDRHDALRTIVRADGYQQVLAEVPPVRVRHADLRAVPEDTAAARLAEVRASMSHEVRDPARWPLFEVRIHRLDAVRTRFHLGLDLLIADAHSTRVLADELLAFYHDPSLELPQLPCSFRDYVQTVHAARDAPVRRAALRYWRDRLAELPPAPALPRTGDAVVPLEPRFERLSTELDAAPWTALRDWCARTGVTPTAVICAAFARVLAVWSASPRFTLNLTTFNRLPLHPAIDAVVGDFTSTTLLAVDASTPVPRMARAVQEQIWRDLEHRTVSGVEVLRMLRRERGPDVLMPVVFTSTLLTGPSAREDDVPRWRARPVYAVSQTPQVLLDHQISEEAGRLVCTWDYLSAALPPGLVEAMFAAFEQVLADLVARAGDADAEKEKGTHR